MLANLDRQTFIDLLDKLSDENDEVVLSAARDLNAQIVVAGATWDDLLIPEKETEDKDPEKETEDKDTENANEHENESPITDEEVRQSLDLIKKLSELKISKELVEELEEYNVDIKEGEFDSSDLNYLKALYKRLSD